MGSPNVRPASPENATNAWPAAPWTVNPAIAMSRPRALSIGPFNGQALIFQPSSWTALGSVQRPFSRRDT
jgi:hypothetical protein